MLARPMHNRRDHGRRSRQALPGYVPLRPVRQLGGKGCKTEIVCRPDTRPGDCHKQHRQHDTEKAIVASFKDFDKWETYGLCYKALTTGAATLAEIQSIAWREAQIKPDIIEMRMTDFDKM